MKATPAGKLYPQALAIAKGMPIEELLKQTELPLSWLRKFRQGSIKSPSVQRVEWLIVATTGKQIEFKKHV